MKHHSAPGIGHARAPTDFGFMLGSDHDGDPMSIALEKEAADSPRPFRRSLSLSLGEF